MSKKTTDVYKKTNEQYVERREFQMKKIADFIVDKRKYVMILYLIMLVISVVGMLHVNVNYDMSKYLPRESFTKVGMEKMGGEYGDLASITVMLDDLDNRSWLLTRSSCSEHRYTFVSRPILFIF